jgi:hypothetical protein
MSKDQDRVLKAVCVIDALDPQDLGPMPVTSEQLFWSPDSRTIGFTAAATLRTEPAGGGPVFVVCKIPASGRIIDARWLTSGAIVFSVWRDNLHSVINSLVNSPTRRMRSLPTPSSCLSS